MKFYSPTPKGSISDGANAEYVELNLRGSSVIGLWNHVTQSFDLYGPDTLESYRSILASARWASTGFGMVGG